jgi:glycosyltransferase involved in cell wall biosynthesis
MRLLRMLVRIPKPDLILVQNPPAFPTFFIAWLASRLRGARFVIDWHNLSHTVAAVRLGERHRAVKAIARSERRWAKRATAHLAVSRALADWLAREYKVKAAVVYDRPGDAFTRHRPPMPRRCGIELPTTRSSVRRGRRSLSVRPAGRPTRTSICCSKRSSAPSGS